MNIEKSVKIVIFACSIAKKMIAGKILTMNGTSKVVFIMLFNALFFVFLKINSKRHLFALVNRSINESVVSQNYLTAGLLIKL
jgi:hypothetical protein